jgi:hypothetical protein
MYTFELWMLVLLGDLKGAYKNRTGIIKSTGSFKELALIFARRQGYLTTVQKSEKYARSGR